MLERHSDKNESFMKDMIMLSSSFTITICKLSDFSDLCVLLSKVDLSKVKVQFVSDYELKYSKLQDKSELESLVAF